MSEPISFKQELLRKTVHLSSLWMPLLMGLTPSRVGAGIFFAVLCLLNLLVEYGYYRNWRGVSWLYGKLFGKMMHNQDRTRFHISGSPPVLPSACLLKRKKSFLCIDIQNIMYILLVQEL